METKIYRIHEYDILKCFGIVMVVMGHTSCPDYLHSLLYYVHMPLFFMLSGCTNRDDEYYAVRSNINTFFLKRVKSLYIPFLKYALPIVLFHNYFYLCGLYPLAYENWHEWAVQISRTLLLSIGTTEPLLGQLWFVKVLFLAEMLYAVLLFILRKWNVNKWYVIAPIGFGALFMNCSDYPHIMQMNLIEPIRAMLFYAIGGWIRNINLQNGNVFAFSWGGVILWFIVAYTGKETSIQGSYGWVALLSVPVAVSFFVMMWHSAKIIMKMDRLDNIVEYIGRNTMPIYFLQYLAFRIVTISYLWLTNHDIKYTENFVSDIPWWLYTLLSLAVSLLIYEISSFLKRYIRNFHVEG